jgi:hypothetical protein
MAETWLVCSACRGDIAYGAKYFQCSVSTCNRARMRLVFCSVTCWDSHVATLRHRDAWAEDKIAPTKAAWEREVGADEPARSSPPPARLAPAPPASRLAATPPTIRPAGTPPAIRATPSVAIPTTQSWSPGATPPATTPPASPSSAVSAAPRHVVGDPPPGPGVHLNDIVDNDVLIVVSKLKKYIKERSGMNCSDAVAEVLSDHVRALCDDSIRAAGRDERKTVLDRDVPRPRR